MTKFYIGVFLSFLSFHLIANEMHALNPTRYNISGNDIYGNLAYTLVAEVVRNKNAKVLGQLNVSIYDHSIDVSPDILQQVTNPDLNDVSATNDAGIHGSFVYIRLPFGKESLFCQRKKYIYISSLPTMSGGSLEAKVIDPCKSQ